MAFVFRRQNVSYLLANSLFFKEQPISVSTFWRVMSFCFAGFLWVNLQCILRETGWSLLDTTDRKVVDLAAKSWQQWENTNVFYGLCPNGLHSFIVRPYELAIKCVLFFINVIYRLSAQTSYPEINRREQALWLKASQLVMIGDSTVDKAYWISSLPRKHKENNVGVLEPNILSFLSSMK